MCKICRYIYLIFFTFPFIPVQGQTTGSDSLRLKSRYDSSLVRGRNQIVPAMLISGGIIIESFNVKEKIQGWFPRTHTTIDDYLRDVPVGELYTYDIFSRKHRNNIFNQTKYLIISRLATGYITQLIKEMTNNTRPNGGSLSFPSGHTSIAFANATVLYNETIDYNPFVAYSGYMFATATGILRITNNRHWVSDVLTGAGIGMLVTNLVYYIEPFKKIDPFRLGKKARMTPELDPSSGRFNISVDFALN